MNEQGTTNPLGVQLLAAVETFGQANGGSGRRWDGKTPLGHQFDEKAFGFRVWDGGLHADSNQAARPIQWNPRFSEQRTIYAVPAPAVVRVQLSAMID